MDKQEPQFKRIQDYIDRMPSLSTTVTKVMEVCNTPNTSANDLNKIIMLDPVLTGQVLKLINSAYYSLPNQITSLARAIIMLGLNTVKNLALSTAVIGTLGKKESFKSLSMDAYWAHSICVGVTAKALAAKLGVPVAEREEYFVAGMLHDLGKIPMNSCFPEQYTQALHLADLEQGPLIHAEGIILGFDHGVAGQMIAQKWQLSNSLIETLYHHHAPEMCSEENRKLVTAVALANIFANVFEIGSAGDLYPVNSFILNNLEAVGMCWEDLSSLYDTVNSEINKAQVFLHVAG
jgi:putative nucleotidyltransferase with HDIG domain